MRECGYMCIESRGDGKHTKPACRGCRSALWGESLWPKSAHTAPDFQTRWKSSAEIEVGVERVLETVTGSQHHPPPSLAAKPAALDVQASLLFQGENQSVGALRFANQSPDARGAVKQPGAVGRALRHPGCGRRSISQDAGRCRRLWPICPWRPGPKTARAVRVTGDRGAPGLAWPGDQGLFCLPDALIQLTAGTKGGGPWALDKPAAGKPVRMFSIKCFLGD